MQFNRLADLLGFTRTELSVIAFLLGVFLFGLGAKYFSSGKQPANNFDYSKIDSLFVSSDIKEEKTVSINDAPQDYKQEVLGLKVQKPYIKKLLPKESSIDLNTATIKMLMDLPGIGEKTAQKIISLREEKGGFQKPDDLLDVKGIGPSKLNKIRKYVFVK